MYPLIAGHHDSITAIAIDVYGKRMATCSSDHQVKVFDYVDNSWTPNDSWRAHDGVVVCVSWARPEFSQLLCTGSHDCTVKIWEEDVNEPFQSGRRWRRRFTISDYKGPVYAAGFSSDSSRIRLASIAADGVLRLHEVVEPNNMEYWISLQEVSFLTHPVSRQFQSSFSLSWAPSQFYHDYLVICVLEDAFIYYRESTGRLVRVAELSQHKGLIRDVAWAPSMGRSYNLIATACKDGFLRIFRVEIPIPPSDDGAARTLLVEKIHESADHQGEVRRVCWNHTGSVLASTGDDAKVRFWKTLYGGSFQCMAVLSVKERTL